MTETAVACDLCGATEYDVVYPSTLARSLNQSDFTVMGELGEYPQIVRCRSCGLVYANPRDDGDELADKYRDMSVTEYLAAEDSRRIIASKDAQLVRQHKPSGSVLDVGCSAGIFLSMLGDGYNLTGIEPSIEASKQAREKVPEAEIFNTILDDAPLAGKSFDVITMWDVIEHLPSPKAALTQLHGLLNDDGIMVMVTPDVGSWLARLMGRRWTHLIRGHIFYFTRESIREMLAETGFEVVSISNYRRYFRVAYVLQRVGLVPNMPEWLRKAPPMSLTLPIDFGDAMLVVVRKK